MQLNIQNPCREDWKKMTPNKTGKHCSSCNKSVIDIRYKSNLEINNLANANKTVCVLANKKQISGYQYVKPIKRLAFALLIVFGNALFSLSANAQEITQQLKKTYLKKDSLTSNSTIKGKVIDENGEEMPFANVGLYSKKGIIITGSSTDFDGNYKINLNDSLLNKSLLIRVSYVSYETKEMVFTYNKKTTLNFYFTLDGYEEIMGDIIILPHQPLIEDYAPANANKTTFKREEIQRSSSGR